MKPIYSVIILVFISLYLCAEEKETWTIKTQSGHVYNDCKIHRVEPDIITIFHSSGMARIPLRDLPPDLQKRFNYDQDKAEEYNRIRKQKQEDSQIEIQERTAKNRVLTSEKTLQKHNKKAYVDTLKFVRKNGIRVKLIVSQVVEGGVLADIYTEHTEIIDRPTGYPDIVRKKWVLASDRVAMIVMPTSNIADGETFITTVYPYGTYQYASIDNAGRTVRKYSVSAEEVAKEIFKDEE